MDKEDKTLPTEAEETELMNLESELPADLSKEINSLKEEVESLKDKLLRSIAESENIRRRYEKMLEETRDYSIVNFAKDLINVIENLSRALEHKPQEASSEVNSLFSGIEMTKQELSSIFNKHGIQEILPQVGEKFDYNLHHAISQIVTEDYNPDTIVNVMQAGYKIKDRLLRPAIVAVSKKSDT